MRQDRWIKVWSFDGICLELCGSGGHVPHRHRTLQKEVRWRPPKWGSHVLAPPGTRRRRATHPGEPPKHAGRPRRAQRAVRFARPAGCHPLGGHHLTSGPSTPTTRAPSVSGMTGWVLAARRASRSAGARTGSICAGVALRRVGPCGTPEALGALRSPSTCPLCTPSGCGGSTRGVRLSPAPMRIPRRARGARCEALAAPHACVYVCKVIFLTAPASSISNSISYL